MEQQDAKDVWQMGTSAGVASCFAVVTVKCCKRSHKYH